jgi:hypothetical protein
MPAALAANGGMQNETAQLVRVDYDTLQEISEAMKALAEQAKEFFVRANEYRFFVEDILKSDWAQSDLSDPETWAKVDFDMHVFAYSGIGSGQHFRVSFASGTFTPIDKESHNLGFLQDNDRDDHESSSEKKFFKVMTVMMRVPIKNFYKMMTVMMRVLQIEKFWVGRRKRMRRTIRRTTIYLSVVVG